MNITDHALVLREAKYGENHRILTVLTKHHGILSVTAKGSLNPKSKFFSAAGLYCYGEWVLQEGRKTHFAKEATAIETFFGLRECVESVYLAAYLAEITQFFSPVGEECEHLLQLLLNSLYVLSRKKKDPRLVKAVFELRSMSEHGFMPDLRMCTACGRYEGGRFAFLPEEGTLLCENCAEKPFFKLSEAALLALRHIVYAESGKIFAIRLKGTALCEVSAASQAYVLQHLHTRPRTLSLLEPLLLAEEFG